jgi:glucose-1-phosphate adenylyltransferase
VGDGCVVKAGAKITDSIIGIRSLVGADCVVENSMVMGADYYEVGRHCCMRSA